MGIYDRNYYRDEQDGNSFFSMNSGGSGRSMVVTLIAINVVVFILDAFTERISDGSSIGQLCHFLSLSESDAFQPWYWFRFLTAAFSHASGQHIFGNMIVLFFFGRPIETMYGSKKFLWMYLTAAVFGNLIWLLAELPNGSLINSSVLGAFWSDNGGVPVVLHPTFPTKRSSCCSFHFLESRHGSWVSCSLEMTSSDS